MTRRQMTAVFGVVALFLMACNGADQDTAQEAATATAPTQTATATASPTPSPTPSPTAAPTETEATEDARSWVSCDHPEGITVDYPEGWHVNDGDVVPPCSTFDPEPVDVPDAQEFFDAAVLVSVEPVGFGTIADPEAQSGRELARRDELIDGHDAVRIETEAQGDALLPDGTRSTRWLVVLGREQTLTATTHETDDADEYESHRDVLDEMVTRLELPDNR